MQHEGVPNFLPDGALQGYTNIIVNVSELRSLRQEINDQQGLSISGQTGSSANLMGVWQLRSSSAKRRLVEANELPVRLNVTSKCR